MGKGARRATARDQGALSQPAAEPGAPALLVPAAPFKVLLPLAAFVRLWIAWTDQGIVWPDEIYQSLEQGHRLAFGYGFIPWEFQDGARSWLFPGLLGALLKVGSWFGATGGQGLVLLAKSFMAAAGVAAVLGTMRAAGSLFGPVAALWAGMLATFFPPSLLFAGRCMTEVASEAVLAGALALVIAPTPNGARVRVGGALAALAVLLRYQNGLLAAGLAVLVLLQGKGRGVRWFIEGAAPILVLGGLLDWLTWGAPFRPLAVYLRYNLTHAQDYGTSPFTHYAHMLWTGAGPAALLVAGGLVRAVWIKARAAEVLLGTLVVYLVVHSFISHKELRFLIPAAPIAFAVAGAGLAALTGPWIAGVRRAGWLGGPPWLGPGVLAASVALISVMKAPGLKFEDMGYVRRGLAERSVWKWLDPFNRLLWQAGAAPDLCGLLVVGPSPIWFGGFSYLHRDVPFAQVPQEALEKGWPGTPAVANYIIVDRDLPPPPQSLQLAAIDGVTLHRREGRCLPSPEPLSRLFGR